MTPIQREFFQRFLDTLPTTESIDIDKVIAEHYCADEYNANECARLINQGIKTASCGLKAGWDIEDEPLPQVGSYSLVLDWQQNPVCVIQLTSVEVCPFNQVSDEFAYAEGEGDRTYAWWKEAHIKFFEWYANEIGVVFSPESELVLERFKKVYPS